MEYPFWVNDFDRVKDHRQTHQSVAKIFEYPVSFWFGMRKGKTYYDKLDKSVKRLLRRAHPALPVMVFYNLPDRDIGQHSKGGAMTSENYLEFMHLFASGIADKSPIVIYEPDGLPHSTLMDAESAQDRYLLMQDALKILTSKSNSIVYVDIGHSNWLDPETAGKLINSVAVNKVRGFSVNVSNFRTTKESVNWALQVSEHTDYKYFVVDTSRNGNGPYGNDWCNPPGRALGTPPTTDTGEKYCDAHLWIKIPGESDGKCNSGPRAGRFWSEYANELVSNTSWIK